MDNYETGIYTDNPDDTLRYMQTTQPVDLCGYPKQETDMVEVVLCKDCRHWNERERLGNSRYGSCSDDDGLLWHDCLLRQDFFCADGERRSE